MSHSAWLFCALLISMVVILFLILKVKLNAAIALVLGSILMGILSGITTLETIDGINVGFGNMLKGMGLPIGFGIILGELVSASGGAKIIADKIVQAFPKNKAIYAIGLAAFVLAIPVYFDVTFVILIPIGMALMKEINKSIAHVVGAITIGAAAAHTMVPPTPAPLAAGEIFGFDTGLMIAFGGIVSLIGVFVVIKIYTMILDKSEKFWKPEKDIATEAVIVKEETKNIMRKYNIKANKSLGQNFLINSEVVEKIIESSEISDKDMVIEIGPGLGTLTKYLLEKARKVLCVELDSKMIRILQDRFSQYENFELINADILKVDLNEIICENKRTGKIKDVKVVANLPYYITTPIIMKLLEEKLDIQSITVMIQKEVADRLIEIPGGKNTGAITHTVYYYCSCIFSSRYFN